MITSICNMVEVKQRHAYGIQTGGRLVQVSKGLEYAIWSWGYQG